MYFPDLFSTLTKLSLTVTLASERVSLEHGTVLEDFGHQPAERHVIVDDDHAPASRCHGPQIQVSMRAHVKRGPPAEAVPMLPRSSVIYATLARRGPLPPDAIRALAIASSTLGSDVDPNAPAGGGCQRASTARTLFSPGRGGTRAGAASAGWWFPGRPLANRR